MYSMDIGGIQIFLREIEFCMFLIYCRQMETSIVMARLDWVLGLVNTKNGIYLNEI